MGNSKAIVRLETETRKFDKGLDDATKKLNAFGKNGLQSVDGIIGSFARLVPAIAAAAGAQEAFNKVVASSDTLFDQYNANVRALSASADAFFDALGRGSFDGFISGLKDVIRYAKEAYAALDEVGTYSIFGDLANSERSKERARLKAEIRTGYRYDTDAEGNVTKTKLTAQQIALDKQALEDIQKEDLKYIKGLADRNSDAYYKAMKEAFSKKGVSFSTEDEWKGFIETMSKYDNFAQAKEDLKELQQRVQSLRESASSYTSINPYTGDVMNNADSNRINARATAIENSAEYKALNAVVNLNEDLRKSIFAILQTANNAEATFYNQLIADNKTLNYTGGSVTKANKNEEAPIVSRELDMPFERFKMEMYEVMALANDMEDDIEIKLLTPEEIKKIETAKKELADFKKNWEDFQTSIKTQTISEMTSALSSLGNAIGGTTGKIVSMTASLVDQFMRGAATIAQMRAQESALLATAQAHNLNALAATADTAATTTDTVAKGASAAAAATDATAQTLDASAKAFNAHSWIPWVGVAMGAGMVATIVSTLKSLPKFADGGMVTKPTYGLFGEAGPEAIIPLDRLEQMMSGDNARDFGGRVEFKIKDSELYGVLSNYETKRNRRV